jgi:hypothetical protein
MTALSKTADSKGRVTLGKEFADRLVIIKKVEDGVVQVTLAEAIPAREAWLHKDKKALATLLRSLDETGRGEFAPSPDWQGDLKAAAKPRG